MITREIGRYISDNVEKLTWEGEDNNIFVDHIPHLPDKCIGIFSTGGLNGQMWQQDYRNPTMQIIARGNESPEWSYEVSVEIYQLLHGRSSFDLTAENSEKIYQVVSIMGLQSEPVGLGMDSSNRHKHSLNYQLEFKEVG